MVCAKSLVHGRPAGPTLSSLHTHIAYTCESKNRNVKLDYHKTGSMPKIGSKISLQNTYFLMDFHNCKFS